MAFNALAQLAALGLSLLFQTLYLVVLARFLGVEDFGRFSLVLAISQILLLSADMGLHNTAIRRIASEPENWEDFFAVFFTLKGALSIAAFVIMAVVGLFLGQGSATAWCAVLFGAGLVLHSSNLSISIAFQARGLLYLASLNTVLLVTLQLILGATALILGGRLAWVGAAYLIACAGAFAVNCVVFQRKAFPLRLVSPAGWAALLKESFPVGISTFFEAAAGRIAFTLLAFLAGTYETGIYATAARITGALRNIPIAIMGAVLPAMAASPDRAGQVRRLLGKSLLLMLVISLPLAGLLFFFAEPLILTVFGPDYAAAVPALRILAWSLIPLFASLACSHLVLSQGRLIKMLPWITGAILGFNLILNLFLIGPLGSQGAAWAQFLTEGLAALFFGVVAARFLRR